MKQICHTYSHSVGLVIVEFIDCCESGGDEDDYDGDVDATFGADDGALQWETNWYESLQREEQDQIGGTDLT